MSKNEIILQRQVRIKIPSRPNFIQIAGADVNTSQIDEKTLREVGREWVELLVKEAAIKRKLK